MMLALIAGVTAAAEEPWSCTEVIDGDTLRLSNNSEEKIVHLFGIDAPELAQAGGTDAKAYLESLIKTKPINIKIKEYLSKEPIVIAMVDDNDLAEAMCDAGYAWLSEEGDTSDAYALKIIMARGQQRGVWSEPEPMHPADWLRKNPPPTPTPEPVATLADLAAEIEINSEDGNVVIDNIPSMYARSREAKLYVERMVQIARAARFYKQMQDAYNNHCQGIAEDGASVWSERQKRWVSSEEAEQGLTCNDLIKAYSAGLAKVSKNKSKATAEASRGGVSQSDIRSVIEALGLGEY
jgi:endonuclease YncB( thermonuclease family)